MRYWGDNDFKFSLQTQTNYEYLASNLVAEAFDQSHVHIAIQCNWTRVKDKRSYKENLIKGNTYPLSADDIGCIIRVEAKPLEEGYIGTAYAEFGPVTVEPATKKSLEYILGSGSSQFPVTIMYPGDRNKLPEDREIDEGTLIVYVDKIKLIKKPGGVNIKRKSSSSSTNKEIFDLKYTIDCPKVHVSQVDSQMLHIDYFEQDEGYVKDKGFTNSLDLRALTRKSRDLIVLSIRCFSALNSYKNSKIISMLSEDDSEKGEMNKLEISKVADLSLELDSVKRELYEQIEANKMIKLERVKLKHQLQEMESEMQTTLSAYSEVIEAQNMNNTNDDFRTRQQLREQQNLTETLQKQIGDLNEQLLILNDERSTLERKLEAHEKEKEKMTKRLKRYKDKNGVPESEFGKLQVAYEQLSDENKDLKLLISKREKQYLEDKKIIQQLETEKIQLSSYLKRKDEDMNILLNKNKEKKMNEK